MGTDASARLLYGVVLEWDEVMYKAEVKLTCGRGHWYPEEKKPDDFEFCPRCGTLLERKAPYKVRPELIAVFPELGEAGVFGWSGREGISFHEAGQIILDYRDVPTPLLLGKEVVTTNSHRTHDENYLRLVRRIPLQHDMDRIRERIAAVARPLGWEKKPCEFVVQVMVSS